MISARNALLWAGPAAALLVGFGADASGVSAAFAITAGLTAWVAIWWVFEPIPAPHTALLPLAVLPLTGVLDAKAVAEAYGNEVILLLAGGFMLSAAIERNGAHRRMAYWMLQLTGAADGRRLLWGFVLASGLISMWISNTATTLLLVPVALAVLERYPDPRLAAPLILGIAYAASFGGLGTPIGTPPNLIFRSVYEQTTGVEISFLDWFVYGLPIVVLTLPMLALWLGRNLRGLPAATLPTLPPISAAERRVLLVFAVVALAWIFRTDPWGGWKSWLGLPGASDASVALLGALAMGLVPDGKGERLLDWDTAERIPWGALILFGGGIALASAFGSSGLSQAMADHLSLLRDWPLPLMLFGLCLGVTLLSEIASNTATAALLMPILAAAAAGAGVDPIVFMLPAALAASLGFMLPVATAPNMIAYGTGKVDNRRMLREGWLLDVLGVAVVATVVWAVFTWRG
ncbi:MAG: SLC13 family permease [Lysobacterales bacterium]